MIEYKTEGLCFDDVLLVPQPSDVLSRRTVNLRMDIGRYAWLDLPVISSPMDTITGVEMARAMAEGGGLGILHRYNGIGQRTIDVIDANQGNYAVGAAVGATGRFIEEASCLVKAGASVICVDTANGHGIQAVTAVRMLRKEFPEIHIMAGNVSTSLGYYELAAAGADSVRVGIGGGSCCTTRLVSGHGLPTLASIIECSRERDYAAMEGRPYAKIIADGGIRNTGDMVKAFAAGADAVMLGSMLAGTNETPGEVTNGFKAFRGMASESAQNSRGSGVSTIEGIATTVRERGPVSKVLEEIALGLGSGCSYSGVHRLRDLQDAAKYVRVSALSLGETRPHAGV